ncbi:MAG: hypothetical protein FWB96_01650 [Defluviitaleaceae bacterium]|nr:hypothetical protein [Defluviitaleaceae bacterium]MCL2261602.1 hypothetical protein [Defluviitaleaceae bacterium]
MKPPTITKWELYKSAIAPCRIVGIVCAIIVWILFFVVWQFSDGYASLLDIVMGGAFMFFLIMGCGTILSLGGIFRLVKQERALKFSFAEEMAKHNITATVFKNESWFINTNNGTVVAFRRDYIKEIKKIKDPNSGSVRLIATLIKFDGKQMKIDDTHETISDFKRWLETEETK